MIDHLFKVIEASSKLGINMVTTFVGRMQSKTLEENFEEFAKVWPPIVRFAEERGVKIAIENCPMLFTKDEWPGGQNIASTDQSRPTMDYQRTYQHALQSLPYRPAKPANRGQTSRRTFPGQKSHVDPGGLDPTFQSGPDSSGTACELDY